MNKLELIEEGNLDEYFALNYLKTLKYTLVGEI